jgi:hypothetical protein
MLVRNLLKESMPGLPLNSIKKQGKTGKKKHIPVVSKIISDFIVHMKRYNNEITGFQECHEIQIECFSSIVLKDLNGSKLPETSEYYYTWHDIQISAPHSAREILL